MSKKTKSPDRSGSLPAQVLAFLRSVKVELALVKWPDRKETIRLTTVVIVSTILIGVYIGGLDLFFTNLLTKLITK